MGALLSSARLGHRGNNIVRQPPAPMVPPVQHDGDVEVPKWISQDHSTVQEGGGAETTAFGGRGGKGVNIKGVQSLWAHP